MFCCAGLRFALFCSAVLWCVVLGCVLLCWVVWCCAGLCCAVCCSVLLCCAVLCAWLRQFHWSHGKRHFHWSQFWTCLDRSECFHMFSGWIIIKVWSCGQTVATQNLEIMVWEREQSQNVRIVYTSHWNYFEQLPKGEISVTIRGMPGKYVHVSVKVTFTGVSFEHAWIEVSVAICFQGE